MTNGEPGPREPDGEESAQEASAGEAQESGTDAVLEGLESGAPYRLSQGELDQREANFARPRKEQGPPLEAGEEGDPDTRERADGDEVEETPPPRVQGGDHGA